MLMVQGRGTILGFALGTALFFCIAAGTPVPAETPPADRLMGLYLYNFLLFVDWPGELSHKKKAIVICLFGKGSESGFLTGIKGKQVREKTIVIEHAQEVNEIVTGCDVLFIRDAERSMTFDLLAQLRDAPCLTISDMPGFAELGGMVEFLRRTTPRGLTLPEGKAGQPTARFRINLEVVLNAGFKIRSRLLRLSEIVGGIPRGKPADR